MFDWKPLPMATQLGKGASEFSQAMELRNLYVQRNPPGSKRPFLIANTPGLASPLIASAGAMVSNGVLFYTVSGDAYYYDTAAHHVDDFGTSIAGAPLIMAGAALRQAVLVAQTLGQWLITTGAVTHIDHPEGIAGDGYYFIDAAYLDRRMLFADGNGSNRLYWSDLDDPTTVGALSFLTVDALGDQLVGVEVCNREIGAYGRIHTEFWYDAGGFPQPYARSPGGVVDIGCFAARSLATQEKTYFLANDLTVRRFTGYEPERISNEWVERLIKAAVGSSSSSIFGHVHFHAGKHFYGLSIGNSLSADATCNLFFDIEEGAWHRRDSHRDLFGSAADTITNIVNHATIFAAAAPISQQALVLTNGKIYPYDETAYRDNGNANEKTLVMTCPEQDADGRRVFEAAAEIVMERTTGVAGTAEYEFSDDGGESFYSMGEVSTNSEQKRWVLCGSFAERRIRRLTIEANHRVSIDGFRGLMEVGQ